MDTATNGDRPASFLDFLKAWPQYVLPHALLSNIMHGLTRTQQRQFKNLFIRWFIKQYNVDMSLAEIEDYRSFDCFNSFFTRKLKPEARPVCTTPGSIACPVDGTVSQIGPVRKNTIFQAKGHDYSLESLLAGQADWSSRFIDGSYTTLYLSPRDYHRIHIPRDGRLKQMTYIPGRLFSVNPATTRAIPGLFARNERVVCLFETDIGAMAVILVGAIFVGSMETVWHGVVTPPHGQRLRHWHYPNENSAQSIQPVFAKGDEIGRFNMGSTVILLFEQNRIHWEKTLACGDSVSMGMELGSER